MIAGQETFSTTLPQTLWTAEQVRDNEPMAAAATGVSMSMLMLRAGQSTFNLALQQWPTARSILVLAGQGNNGGDAYVVASLAKKAQLNVQLVQVGSPEQLTGIAKDAKEEWLNLGGSIKEPEQADLHVDFIVDGLLGTGLTGEVRPAYLELIARCNYSPTPVIAIDVPSGLNANTGSVCGDAIKATHCITFVGLKQGLFTGLASEYCGQLWFAGLGIEKAFERQGKSNKKRVIYNELQNKLAPRARTVHKGDLGRVLLVGGNRGMAGAIRLAGEACLRGGAGLVTVATHRDNMAVVSSGCPELMVSGLSDCDLPAMADFEPLNRASVLLIGPGLGQDPWAKALLESTLSSNIAKVVDADALNYLAGQPQRFDNWILTPHSGEAARLLGITVAEVEADRYTAAQQLQSQFGGVVVLKGPGTLICSDDTLLVANVGNPGMASGGMGDLLAGLIAALLAQGLDLFDAAAAAVCIHGGAGDLAAEQGERGMLASDLLPHIRRLVNPK